MLEIKMHHKTKVDQQHRFFLRIFFPTHFDLWKCLKKFWWVVVVVAFLNIVSTPGPGFVKVKARFDQVGD